MKSSYELAMERLNKSAPVAKLTAEQKKHIAELESKCKAKIAELELSLKEQIDKAAAAGDFDKIAELQKSLIYERKSFQADLEDKKSQIHKIASDK